MKYLQLILILVFFVAAAAVGRGKTEEKSDEMQAEIGPTVLFFYADWCPTCKTAMRDIDSRIPDLGNITVVVVDYDKENQLKRKYGITYQHTYVQIDPMGEKVALWSGGAVDDILKKTVWGS